MSLFYCFDLPNYFLGSPSLDFLILLNNMKYILYVAFTQLIMLLQSSNPGQFPQGNETEGVRGNVGGQSQAGNQAQSGQGFPSQPFQSLPQVVQIPLATAAIPIPSLNSVLLLVYTLL